MRSAGSGLTGGRGATSSTGVKLPAGGAGERNGTWGAGTGNVYG